MFRNGEIHKTYWAIVTRPPFEPEATLTDWLVRNERQNKSYAYNHQVPTSKKSILHYKVINQTDHYTLLEGKPHDRSAIIRYAVSCQTWTVLSKVT